MRRVNCTTGYIQYFSCIPHYDDFKWRQTKNRVENWSHWLGKAAQKAVEELGSQGLLDKGGMKDKLEKMRKQANNHQRDIEELMLSVSLQLDSINIQKVANETVKKASEMMSTYLDESPDSSEAIEYNFLLKH